MYKVIIKNNKDTITNFMVFSTMEESLEWIAFHENSQYPWGYIKNGEYTVLPIGAENYSIEERINELTNENYQVYIVPKQYVVEILDLSQDTDYIKQNIEQVVQKAISFGQKITSEFIAENIYLGITQANKTKEVRQALQEVFNALQTGSLYDAIDEAKKVTYRDNTFVTDARLLLFINKIETYLNIPLSTEV